MIVRIHNWWYDTVHNMLSPDLNKLKDSFGKADLLFCNSDSSFVDTANALSTYINQRIPLDEILIENAGIAPTKNCCLRCGYCSQSSIEGNTDKLSHSDIEAFLFCVSKQRVIRCMAEGKVATLKLYLTGGGEPTYNWNTFCDIIGTAEKICHDNEIEIDISMTTNGILNSDQQSFVSRHVKYLLVSYDGIPALQNKNRPLANGEKTAQAVEDSIKYFIAHGNRVTIRSTIWQKDFDRIREIGEYLIEKFPGLFAWEINPVTPAGRATNTLKRNKSAWSELNFVSEYTKVKKYFEDNCKIKVLAPILSHSFTGFPCGGTSSNIKALWLLPDRRIVTCIDSSDIVTDLGKIEDGKIIWNKNYSDILLQMGEKMYHSCRDKCSAFPVCGGGCPIKHIRESQDHTEMITWECEMERAYWDYVLGQLIEYGVFDNLYLEEVTSDVFTIKEREML